MPQPVRRFDYSGNQICIFFAVRGDEVSGKFAYFFGAGITSFAWGKSLGDVIIY
jgi:hypothetical protein